MATQVQSENFLDFTDLSDSDWNLFCNSNLDYTLKSAFNLLEKRIGKIDDVKPYQSEVKVKLTVLIKEMLLLIGKHRKDRFKSDPHSQNIFFRKPGERETFVSYLNISMWEERHTQIVKKEGQKAKFSSIRGEVFAKEAFKDNAYSNKLTYCESKLTDTELRAVGLIYSLNLVWLCLKEAFQSPNPEKISYLLKITVLMSTILDGSRSLASRQLGGKNKSAQTNSVLSMIERTYTSLSRAKKIQKAKIELRKLGLKTPSQRTFARKFTDTKKK